MVFLSIQPIPDFSNLITYGRNFFFYWYHGTSKSKKTKFSKKVVKFTWKIWNRLNRKKNHISDCSDFYFSSQKNKNSLATASETSYKPKQRSYGKTKLHFFFRGVIILQEGFHGETILQLLGWQFYRWSLFCIDIFIWQNCFLIFSIFVKCMWWYIFNFDRYDYVWLLIADMLIWYF